MYATVRQYKDMNTGAIEELGRRSREVETLLKSVPGFERYDLLKTPDGMTSVTVCMDQVGAEESNRRVASWIKEHMPTYLPNPPAISAGEVVVHAGR
jgi:hypothetical protein